MSAHEPEGEMAHLTQYQSQSLSLPPSLLAFSSVHVGNIGFTMSSVPILM